MRRRPGRSQDDSAAAAAADAPGPDLEHLERLHAVVLDSRLGPLWWLERFPPSVFAAENAGELMAAVLDAFGRLRTYLSPPDPTPADDLAAHLRTSIDALFEDLRDPGHLEAIAAVLAQALDLLRRHDLAEALRRAADSDQAGSALEPPDVQG